MLRRELKWHKLFANEQDLKDLFSYKSTIVHRSMFGEVVLVKKDSAYYAFKNKCPHQGKSLEGCWIDHESIVCPFHKFKFSLNTGKGHGLYLDQYELRINENGVFLGKEGWVLF